MSLDVNISEPEEFSCVELHSCLEDVAKVLDFNDFKYHVDLISGKGESYVANIFRVVIKENEDNGKNVNVIVKTLINTTRRELFRDLHNREVLVYEEVIPKFMQIQRKLDLKQRFCFPECLYTNANKNKEIIVLQDLKDIGFGIDERISKFEELNYKQTKLILTQLAKLHALSFVYEKVEKENFDKVKEKFADILFQEKFLTKSKLRNYFFESYDMSLKFVTNIEAKKKLNELRNKLVHILRFYTQPSKHNVLCHGDVWLNNILFKEEGEEDEICFLDYQVMRYCSPVIDIIYFMYLSTTSKFRSENFEDLQQVYYDSLKSFLNLYDLNVNNIYPWTEFIDELKYSLPFGLIMALVEMRIITTSPEDEAILRRNNIEFSVVPGEVELFKYRVNDLVEESISNGVLVKLLETIAAFY
ncbi:unnamed protein product [Diatraea saccharalis]|uniref:CHK kinase-like domain-containing protein n=1 Tax=Diatraea saccharalis TaxID=40085 RepID=A0A9N9WGY0_9NEOP|nr:unnamed protein product [Diatraea saccharalis]